MRLPRFATQQCAFPTHPRHPRHLSRDTKTKRIQAGIGRPSKSQQLTRDLAHAWRDSRRHLVYLILIVHVQYRGGCPQTGATPQSAHGKSKAGDGQTCDPPLLTPRYSCWTEWSPLVASATSLAPSDCRSRSKGQCNDSRCLDRANATD